MTRYRFDVEVPEGTHLSFSRKGGGGMSALLRDDETNRIVDHAVLLEPDDDDEQFGFDSSQDKSSPDDTSPRSTSDEERAEFVANVLILLAQACAPHVKAWWRSKGGPKVRAAPGRIKASLARSTRRKETDGGKEAMGLVATSDAAAVGRSANVAVHDEEPAYTMTNAEAQQRFTEAVVAMVFAQELMLMLRSARIIDDEAPFELDDALSELSPQQVESVRRTSEGDPSLLNATSLASLLWNPELDSPPAEPVRLAVRSLGKVRVGSHE